MSYCIYSQTSQLAYIEDCLLDGNTQAVDELLEIDSFLGYISKEDQIRSSRENKKIFLED